MPYVGDDYLTVKEYKDLRQKWREAQTTTPWKAWATWYLSPAGKRDRAAVERHQEVEARNRRAGWDGIVAQQAAMAHECGQGPKDPEVERLRELANERDETGGYSMGALKAQHQLAALGVQPEAGRVG